MPKRTLDEWMGLTRLQRAQDSVAYHEAALARAKKELVAARRRLAAIERAEALGLPPVLPYPSIQDIEREPVDV